MAGFSMLVGKLYERACKSVLGVDVVYRIAKRLYSANSGKSYETVRLSAENATKILDTVSPKPEFSSCPKGRKWPSIPEVDISVVIPCYNVERYIDECLQSVLSQVGDFTFEVVAVDDGSTDKTGEILDKYAEDDRRVRVFHQINQGLSGARNSGLEEVRGNYICFLDSDDLLETNALQTLYLSFDRKACDYVTGLYCVVNDCNVKMYTPKKRNHGAPWGRLYSREIWRNLEFPEGLWFEDTVQALLIQDVYREREIPNVVIRYRRHGESISTKSYYSKRAGADTFWVVQELLQWRVEKGMAVTEGLREKLLNQFGPLAFARSHALNRTEMKALFYCMADEFNKVCFAFDGNVSFADRWCDLESSLVQYDFRLWCLAVRAL